VLGVFGGFLFIFIFGSNQTLKPSKAVGELIYIKDNDRYIIFLTTKNKNKQKTTYENIFLSLLNLKFCVTNNL
jgi:hypothetical protein